jgi:hypothetical protein
MPLCENCELKRVARIKLSSSRIHTKSHEETQTHRAIRPPTAGQRRDADPHHLLLTRTSRITDSTGRRTEGTTERAGEQMSDRNRTPPAQGTKNTDYAATGSIAGHEPR